MSHHHPQHNSAKILLPFPMVGMLLLVAIMYYGGLSSGWW